MEDLSDEALAKADGKAQRARRRAIPDARYQIQDG